MAVFVAEDSVVINWDGLGSTQWEFEHGASGFTQGMGTSYIVNTDTFTSIAGLSAKTTYDYYIRSICSVGDTSDWVSGSFTTNCSAFAMPYTEGFNSSSTDEDCWTIIDDNGDGDAWDLDYTSNPFEGDQSAIINTDFNGTNNDDYLISPAISISGPLRMIYQTRAQSTFEPNNYEILVSTTGTDPADFTDTVFVDTVSSTTYLEETIDLSSYSGDIYVAFHIPTGSLDGWRLYLDEIIFEEIPTCPTPSDVTDLNSTSTSIDIAWQENGTGTQWEVEYGAPGFTAGTGTINNNVLNDTLALTGLTALTSYDVYVRTICAVGDTSLRAPVHNFFFAGPPLSGTYTVNSALVSGGTNFQSFSDLAAALSNVGVSGAVTVNVVSGSGPYTEQVIFESYAGASSTNNVTINGNGETISYNALTGDRRIVGFDGAKHITLDSLTIQSLSTLYGFGVHFTNDADSNSIVNCTIDMSSITSTSSANSAAILSSGSVTSITQDGSNASYLTIDNNDIIGSASGGAYYGVYLNGNGVSSNAFGNEVTNNTLTDFYSYGIYLDDQEDALIGSNDISRPNRTASTTQYGIYTVSGSSQNNLIEKNAIHAMQAGDASPTSTAYLIYNSSNDASVGNENRVENNIIYDINGTGTIYAIYNSGSDNIEYYHNTISLDDASATGGTTRGFYQTTTASGIDFRNNIISITRGGSGTKHGIYLNATASTITCDYNNVYVNSAGSGAQHYGRYSSDQTSLSNWQTANAGAYGQNSFESAPIFTSNTDLTPASTDADASGFDLSVLEDFFGAARTTTPDLGAIEFTPPSCPRPLGLNTADLWSDSTNVFWTESGSATQWEVEYGLKGFTQGTGTSAIINTDTLTSFTGLAAFTEYDFYVRAICGPADTSAWSQASFTTLKQLPATAVGVNCTVGNSTVIFSEEFDAGSNGWTGDINGGNGTWEIPGGPTSTNTGPNTAHSGPSNSFMSYEASSTTANDGSIVSPAIDLASTGTAEAELSFWIHAYGLSIGELKVGVGTSPTGPFTTEFTWVGDYQTDGNDPWFNVGLDLSTYIGDTIYIEFFQKDSVGVGSDFDGDIGIDLVEVTTCEVCEVPTALNTTDVLNITAQANWTKGRIDDSWELQWDTAGFASGAARNTIIVNSDTFALMTGLSSTTDYDFYLRSICGPGDTSGYSAVGSFTTAACQPVSGINSSNVTTGAADLSWTENSIATEWEVQYDTAGYSAGTARNIFIASGTPASAISGLMSNTSYDFYIRAICAAGDTSSYSTVYNLVTPVCLVPNTLASTPSSNLVDLSWTEAGTASSWEVQIGATGFTVGTGTSTIVSTIAATQVTALSANTGYDWYVRSICGAGDTSAWSTVSSFTTILPPAVTNLQSTVASNIADLTWTENGTALEWEVEYGTSGFTQGTGNVVIVSTTSTTLSSLLAFQSYDWYVRAISGPGDTSVVSAMASFTTFGITNQCDLVLKLEDSGNNGWQGNTLDVTIDGITTNYTLASGDEQLYTLPVNLGDSVILNYLRGGLFTTQVSFELIDASNAVIYSSGLNPALGPNYADTAKCPSCVNPSGLMVTSVSSDTAFVSWTEEGGATEWELEWGAPGYVNGSGTSMITASTDTFIAGLGSLLDYEINVRSICGPGDTSGYPFRASFRSDFVCPMNAVCAGYVGADIPTDYDFRDLGDRSVCPGSLVINIPAGNRLDSMSVTYDMTSHPANFAWRSEQRSWLYSPQSEFGESSVTSGVGDVEGTFVYERGSLNFANKLEGDVVVEMHGGRALNFGPTGCGADYISVDAGTWNMIAYYSASPACSEPIYLKTREVGNDTAQISWIDYNSASYEIEYDLAGFTAGMGSNSVIVTDTFTTLTALTGFSTYDYYIRTICGPADTSAWSERGSFTTLCGDASSGLSASATTDVSADVNWVENGISTQWIVEWDLAGYTAGSAANSMVVNTNTFTTLTGLSASTSYDFYVRPICAVGDTGVYSTVGNFSTNCGIPSSMSTSAISTDSAVATWIETGISTSWEVEWDTSGYTAGNGNNSSIVSDTTAVLNSLSPSTNYDWYVRAICGAGDSSEWSMVTSFLSACGPAPSGLAVSANDDVTANVNWVENGGASSWSVEYGTAGFTTGSGTTVVVNADTFTTLIGLTPSTSYDFYVRAICGPGDTSVYSTSGSFTTICGVPVTLTTTNVESNQADLNWVELGSALSWEVEWDTAGYSLGTARNSAIATSATINASGLMSSTDYDFYVRSICGAADTSLWSTVGSFTTLDCGAPTNLRTSEIGRETASLVWDESGSATSWEYSYGATGFTVGSGTQMVVTTDSAAISGLMSGTGYDWYVRAICASGDTSMWSAVTSFTTAICEIPTSLATSNIGRDTVDVSWTENGDATSWEISYGATDFAVGTGTQMVVSATTETISGLMSGTGYDWYVRAICAVGDTSDWSDTASFTTRICEIPTGLATTNIGRDTADVSWMENGDAASWEISFGATDFTVGTGTQTVVSNMSETLSGLMSGTGYDWYVRAICAPGDTSAWSDTASFTTRICEIPTALISSNVSTDTADLSWMENGDAASWEISYGLSSFMAGMGTQVIVSSTSTTLSGLTPNTGYDWYVRAICAPGDTSAWSDSASFITNAPYYPIGTINTEDTNGVADSLNVYCWTSGIVMRGDLDGNAGLSFYITDLSSGSQEGMNVFNFNDVSNYVVTEGDSIRVRGPIIQFNGLTELNVDSIEVVSTGNALPAPMAVTSLDESTEAKLIEINDLVVITGSGTGTGSYNFNVANATDTLTIRVDSDTELHDSLSVAPLVAGDTICSVIGIGAQFDSSNPFTDGYQIFPFTGTDVDTLSCIPIPTPYYPVGTINTSDTNGVADSIGTYCWTSGIVMGVDLDGNAGLLFTMIDMSSGSQEGIALFNFVDVSGYVVTQGDSIRARGTVSQFNGLTQLTVDSIEVVATGVTEPTPITVWYPSEGTESKWIQINNVEINTASGSSGSNLNMDASRDGFDFTIRIDRDTDVDDSLANYPLAVGDSICSIVGIGGQFDSSNPYDTGYQIIPARFADIDTSSCAIVVGINDEKVDERGEFVLSPNPTNGEFTIRTSGFNSTSVQLIVRDMNGRVLIDETIINANNTFQKAFDISDNAKGLYFISILDGEEVINKKLILQ